MLRAVPFWLKLWLLTLLLLFAAVPVLRQQRLTRLQHKLAGQLTTAAGQPANLLESYLYGYDPVSGNYVGYSLQGQSIWLINQGYKDPSLLRGILRAEAQRVYDGVYLSPSVNNYDLRTGLIMRLAPAKGGDAALVYSALALELAGGDERAVISADSLITLCPDAMKLEALATEVDVPAEHILGRICAAYTLGGRDDAAADLLESLWQQEPYWGPVAFVRARYLQDQGRWAESLPYLEREEHQLGDDPGYFYEQAALHSGDAAGYLAAVDAKLAALKAEAAATTNTWLADEIADLSQHIVVHEVGLRAGLKDPAQASDPQTLYELWLLTGSAATRARLLARPAELDGAWPGPEADWEAREDWSGKRYRAGVYSARLLAEEGQWQAAQQELMHVAPEMEWDSRLERDYDELWLLTRLALRQPLADPVPPRTGVDVDPQAQSASDSDYEPAPPEPGQPQAEEAGPLAALRDGDRLTAMLRSPLFAAAMQQNGGKASDVLKDVQAATRPYRDVYSDMSNGTLPLGW